ncbi:cytoplasmic dynein 2 light intermediate chain 1 [Fopius arisanus]|uniref:Cytoplasmic dynein 2 light intermediate chain 1 n=1 Tax=Fopius arisanus TaxID=64838 RepID=A0A9R1TIJ9_9HYME|nr:PREDICTED: cytoplasmic dynein 2 light intermediate chain 1 [Fopius arisanus]
MKSDNVENMRGAAVKMSIDEERKKKNDMEESRERSIIIIGSKRVGKTTMVYRFLEKDETAKPTIAMDYSYGRKAGKSLMRDIVHIWEIGHLTSSLISAAVTGASLTHSPHHITLMVILDLTSPSTLWSTLEESLAAARSAMKMSLTQQIIEEMKQRRIKEFHNYTEKQIDLFPMKLCIVGGKYDEFKDYDLGKKQMIGKTLRAVACNLGADLQYYSSKDSGLVRKMKDLLSWHGFSNHPMKGICSDLDKALLIPAGTDSFTAIDLKYSATHSTSILETIKQGYLVEFPTRVGDSDVDLEDPANDPNFNEAIIDRLKSQREEEIAVNLRDIMEGRSPKIIIPDPY